MIDSRQTLGHPARAAEKEAAGIGVLWEAAMSRTAFALRLFCRLGAPSFGQPGGRSRKARRSFPGTPTPVRSALPIGVGMAVHNRKLRKQTMKAQPNGAPAPSGNPPNKTLPRRRLAPNVIAMHADDRPPVVQPRRRGRWPACVASLWRGRSRLYVGALCALRTPLNDDVPVRILEIHQNGNCLVEIAGTRGIVCQGGDLAQEAIATNQSLIRTATLGEFHV